MSTHLMNQITTFFFKEKMKKIKVFHFMWRETQIIILSSLLINRIEDPLPSLLSSSN